MKSQLEIIEKRLQEFFEHQLQNLGGKDLYSEVANSVLHLIDEKISLGEDKSFAPNIYRIFLKPVKPLNPEEVAAFTDTLKSIIKNICQEEKLSLSGPIHIHFFNDEKLATDFKIEVSFSTPPTRDTTRIMVGNVESGKGDEAVPGYLITSSDEIFEIKNKITNIGRREGNEMVIDNLLVSRLHAQIRAIDGKHVLFDIDSNAGTRVNGQKIRQQTLSPGDVIEIADYSLIYYQELDEKYRSASEKITKRIS